ncbi:site-specific DNA-methyltransferase [Paenibacillus rhizovicinus]|uniref:Site-specific DNA-methyltransferase n=1 Tax=Paenibacillus rhizovicinus TaxID=2704463 RepID=A0A6C0P390_9BACL|nr:site-specific DNA-methyltransferase [Paenibacillus rhizovicinus]QHW32293.1 site-specific DNA-methyltransferase [Paenibacillus rhizovicinus]
MNRLSMQTTDKVKGNIDKIAELFPGVVKEARTADGQVRQAIDFDLLRQELSDVLVEGTKERYQLTWPGKKETILSANAPVQMTLRPIIHDSMCWNSTRNLYIEGENLQILKLLQRSYLNKVKCIYVDPPYNTGKDFIYKDDYKSHGDWLSDMHPRLRIARELLKEDGVMFISIDDIEMANLKMLCDEVFGADNFVANLIWANKEGGGGSDSKHFRVKHEYILCYAKSVKHLSIKGVRISNESRYTLQDEHAEKRGSYYLQKLNQASIQYSASLDYPITAPDGRQIRPAIGSKQACWRWSEAKVKWGLDNGFIVMKKDHKGDWQVYSKQYMNVDNQDEPIVRTNRPLGLIEEYSSTQASKKLELLFGAKVFDYSKPYELIQFLLSLTTEADDLIVDFFSGSATTAHAVMQLNAEDGGHRKYIMIQLPEETAEGSEARRAGYANICEIGKERIRRAGSKMKEGTSADIDYGFRVYRLDDTNMTEAYDRPDSLGFDGPAISTIKEERTGEDVLVQAMLGLGLELSLPMGRKTSEGKTVYDVDGNALLACFDRDLPESVIEAIAEQQPLRVVFRESAFKDDAARIRLEERFTLLSPCSEISIL